MKSRVCSFFAVLLLALWLPVTQHCGLEAAGMLAHGCAEDLPSHCDSDATCEVDVCDTVESGNYRTEFSPGKVSLPVLVDHVAGLHRLLYAPELDTGDTLLPRAQEQGPPPWVPIWAFERRAAAPAHAPDSADV